MKRGNIKFLVSFIILSIICSTFSNYNFVNADTIYIGYDPVLSYTEDINELKSLSSMSDGEVDIKKSVEYNNDGTFNVTLMAEGKEFITKLTNESEYNIVFVIDNSGSMYNAPSRIKGSTDAINEFMRELSSYQKVNISVVSYSSVRDVSAALGQHQAAEVLKLGHYNSTSSTDTFIKYEDNYDGTTSESPTYTTGRFLMPTTTQNGNVPNDQKFYAGNTNIQAGIIKAYEVLNAATNKDTSKPVIILMSDGESTNYAYTKGGDYLKDYRWNISSIADLENNYDIAMFGGGDFNSVSIMPYVTIRTAMYIKDLVNEAYEKDCEFYTFGYDIDPGYYYAVSTLNPTKANIDALKDYMLPGQEKYGLYYLVYNSGLSFDDIYYTDGYYTNATGKSAAEIYKEILLEESKAQNPAVKPDTKLTITDTLTKEMDIKPVDGVIRMTLTDKVGPKDITLTTTDQIVYTYEEDMVSVKYDGSSKKVTLTVDGEYFVNKDIELTFKEEVAQWVRGSEAGSTYYTNDTAQYSYYTSEYNPKYKGSRITGTLDDTGSIVLGKIPAQLQVKHLDKYTRELLDSSTIDGYVGDVVNTSSKTIPNYTLSDSPVIEEYMLQPTLQTVEYLYIKNANVTAKYVDENTGAEIATQERKTYKEKENYSTIQKSIDSYTFTRVDGNTSGTVGRSDITVTYYYKKDTGIVAKYVDKTTREEIADAEPQTGLVGDDYETTRKTIDGYTYESVIGNETGKMTEDQITVTYEYLKNANVITKYVDENTGAEISAQNKDTYKEGDNYTTVKKDIAGYTYTTSEGVTSGTIAREDITVTYKYKQNAGIVVKYIDQITKEEIADATAQNGVVGQDYTTTPKQIDGYTLAVTPSNANGKMTESQITVTYEYIKNTDVVTKHIDQVTKEEIADSSKEDGLQGQDYTTTSKKIDGYVLVLTPNNATGKMAATEIVVTYEYRKLADVITKFVDENTGSEISDQDKVTYKEGDNYTTTKKDITGYTYTKSEGQTSGTMGRENVEVTYYYKKGTGVVAQYVDKTTREEIESQVPKTGLEGDNYTTEKKTINGYTWVSTVGEAEGKMTAEQITVTYEYLKNANVITKYVDENTGAEISTQNKDTYKEGDNYTTVKKDIDGYTYTTSEGETSGTIGREDITVTYKYKQNTGIVVKHIDQVTKEEIADATSQNGLVGQDYTTAPKQIEGYTLVVTPNNANGKMSESQIIVTYEYLKNTDVVTKHIDQVTKQEIADRDKEDGLEGQDYTTNSKTIEGYTLVVTPNNKAGKMIATEIVVTYEYLKNTSVKTRHIDQVTKLEIANSTTRTGLEGEEYTTSSTTIPGYTLVVTPNNANGNMTADSITVTYEYLKNTGVVAKYIDQVTGEDIADVVPQTGLEGQDYVTTEKTISGYELVKTPENKTGKMTNETITVVYEYRKLADVVTRYIDENTNIEITAFVTDTYKEGSEYTTDKKDITGYTFTKSEGETSGTIGRENIEVKYYYKKTAAGVVVNYIDQVTGSSVAIAESLAGLENDPYTTEAKVVDGYTLVVIPENKEGTMTTDTIVVTYEYLKNVKVTTKYIDLNTNEELDNKIVDTYLQGDSYSTIRKNFEGYQFMMDTENVAGIMEDKDIEVIYYYRPISSGVIVKYVDKDNDELLTEDTIAGLIGDKYTTTQFTFEDYNFVEVIGQTEGTLQKDPIEVTYYYIKKHGTVTISYVDEEGNELYHEDLEDYVKEEWKHEEKEIYGYEIIERPDEAEGIFIDGNIDLVYVLKRIKGTIIVKFTDKEGNVLAEEEFAEDFVGENFDLEAPEINGYKIIENAKVQEIFEDGQIIVTVIYEKIPETGDINIVMLIGICLASVIVTFKKVLKIKNN